MPSPDVPGLQMKMDIPLSVGFSMLTTANARNNFMFPRGVRQIISSVGQGLLNVHSVTLPASLEQIEDGLFKEVARLDRCVMAFPVTDPKEAQRIIKKVFDWETLAWAYLDGNVTACDLVLEALKKQTY